MAAILLGLSSGSQWRRRVHQHLQFHAAASAEGKTARQRREAAQTARAAAPPTSLAPPIIKPPRNAASYPEFQQTLAFKFHIASKMCVS